MIIFKILRFYNHFEGSILLRLKMFYVLFRMWNIFGLKEGYFFINRKLFWFGKVFQYTWKWGKYFLEDVLHWIKRGQRFNDQTNPKGHLKEKGKRNKLKKEKKTQCNINIMNFLSYFMNILLPSQSLYSIHPKKKIKNKK